MAVLDAGAARRQRSAQRSGWKIQRADAVVQAHVLAVGAEKDDGVAGDVVVAQRPGQVDDLVGTLEVARRLEVAEAPSAAASAGGR